MSSVDYALWNFVGHFTVTAMAGTLIFPRPSRKARLIFYTALCSTFVDLDHFDLFRVESGVNTFHNIFAFTVIPFFIAFAAYYSARRNPWNATRRNGYCFTATLFLGLTGHLVLDIIDRTGLRLLYPFARDEYFVNSALEFHTAGVFVPRHVTLMLVFGASILVFRQNARRLEKMAAGTPSKAEPGRWGKEGKEKSAAGEGEDKGEIQAWEKKPDEKSEKENNTQGAVKSRKPSPGQTTDRFIYGPGAAQFDMEYYSRRYRRGKK